MLTMVKQKKRCSILSTKNQETSTHVTWKYVYSTTNLFFVHSAIFIFQNSKKKIDVLLLEYGYQQNKQNNKIYGKNFV